MSRDNNFEIICVFLIGNARTSHDMKGSWIIALSFLTLVSKNHAQDPNCDFYQNVLDGQSYSVYSPNYPSYYAKGLTCRWQATCPAYTRCRLQCTDVLLPQSTNCAGDRILISSTGDPTLTNADKFCGHSTFDVLSFDNHLAVGFVSTWNSVGGRFLCTLSSHFCQCGWKFAGRIVGGQETGINEFPMMVGLVDLELKMIYCGATIITERWVITAAHCVTNIATSNVGVLYGEHNVKLSESPVTTLIRAIQFKINPNYFGGLENDIALVKTDVKIIFGARVGPACLPFKYYKHTFDNIDLTALGWGSQSFAGVQSDYLQKVNLKVMDLNTCVTKLGNSITQKMICTYTPSKDSCQYDSGGPLLYQDANSGRVYLIGIIVGGEGCATTKPSVNTRITEYFAWIESVTAGEYLCNM